MTGLKLKAKKKSRPTSLYSVHPGVKMVQTWIATLEEKTGRTLEVWIDLIRTKGPKSQKERRVWLKDKFDLGTNTASWLAENVEGTDTWDGDPQTYLKAAAVYVENMYSGQKAELRPLHDRLIKIARSLGKDVKICPCKTIVPLYRKHVFAEIKPATRARIDFGLSLRDTPFSDRLLDTGGREKKNRITHKIEITSLADIDAEVRHWLRVAYELDSKSS